MGAPGFYEFFAGGGMARAGLGDRWTCLFANDFDSKKAEAYAQNWDAEALHVGDVSELTPDQLPGRADLVWASFPCQDISLAGAGAGLRGSRSGTFWPFWRLLARVSLEGRKPRTIVLENVCGLLTSHGGRDFAAICEAIGKAGYWFGALVIDAQLFLPQSRPRLFIVAIDQDLNIPGRVLSGCAVDSWHPARLREAYAGLSPSWQNRWLWLSPPIPPNSNLRLADVIDDEPSGVDWHSDKETKHLIAMMSAVNRAKVELVTTNQARAVGAIYKRTRIEAGKKVQRAEVRFDLAGCLRTPAGGSSRQTIIIAQNGKLRSRLISPRETARLMGLPEEYRLPERYNEACHLTGDGVAVPVVRHIAEWIIEPVLAEYAPQTQRIA
jgi:DNA (cytosine-5)-methyltransferase 1